jgi:phospholipid/cholesterol/gamma-HCH transport system substrate-binding protein
MGVSRLERLYSPPEIGAPGKRQAQGRRRDLLLAGIFVLSMAAVVVGVLTLLSPGLFRGYALRAYFLDADGLGRGIDVIQEGFVIGAVQSVDPVFADDDDRDQCPAFVGERAPDLPCFRATLRIQDAWPVPPQSKAQLAPGGLLQGNVIRIYPSVLAGSLEDDDPIATLARQPDLPAQIAAALEQAQLAIDQTIRPALVQIQERIQGLLGSATAAADGEGTGTAMDQGLTQVFDNLKQLSDDVQTIVDPEKISAILAAVQEMTANLAKVSATFTDRSADLSQAVRSYDALAGDIRRVVNENEPALSASLEDTQYLLQELAAALTPILANIETASRNLAALSGDLRQDPKSLLFNNQPQAPSPWFKR